MSPHSKQRATSAQITCHPNTPIQIYISHSIWKQKKAQKIYILLRTHSDNQYVRNKFSEWIVASPICCKLPVALVVFHMWLDLLLKNFNKTIYVYVWIVMVVGCSVSPVWNTVIDFALVSITSTLSQLNTTRPGKPTQCRL